MPGLQNSLVVPTLSGTHEKDVYGGGGYRVWVSYMVSGCVLVFVVLSVCGYDV